MTAPTTWVHRPSNPAVNQPPGGAANQCPRALFRALLGIALAALSSGWIAPGHASAAVVADGDPAQQRPAVAAAELVRLGTTQLRSGEFQQSRATFAQAIEAIEAQRGRWDPALAEALTGRADALAGLQRHEQALADYERAQHIARINDGLYTLAQIPILHRMAESLGALGRWQDATLEHFDALRIAIRGYGEDSMELIPSLNQMGAWMRRVGNIYEARFAYQQVIDIIEAHHGPEDLRLVDALGQYAATFADQRAPSLAALRPPEPVPTMMQNPLNPHGFSASPNGYFAANGVVNRYGLGEQALRRALQIQATHGTNDIDALIVRLTNLGDWYILFDKPLRATESYRLAQQLNGVDNGRDPLFATPVPISVLISPPVDSGVFSSSRSAPRIGYVEMIFQVDARGRVLKPQVTAADPPGRMNLRALRGIRNARFRPRFDGPDPVITDAVTLRHEYQWRPTQRELKAAEAKAAQKPPPDQTMDPAPGAAPTDNGAVGGLPPG